MLLVCDEMFAEDVKEKTRTYTNICYLADLEFLLTADAMKTDAIFLTF
jgi:hypothetical protein